MALKIDRIKFLLLTGMGMIKYLYRRMEDKVTLKAKMQSMKIKKKEFVKFCRNMNTLHLKKKSRIVG